MKYLGYIVGKNGKTHTGKDKKSGGGDEKNVAHWRKVVAHLKNTSEEG